MKYAANFEITDEWLREKAKDELGPLLECGRPTLLDADGYDSFDDEEGD